VKAERMRLEGIAKPLTAVGGAVRSGAARAGAKGRRAGSAVRPQPQRST
jgi:hypothetical protein